MNVDIINIDFVTPTFSLMMKKIISIWQVTGVGKLYLIVIHMEVFFVDKAVVFDFRKRFAPGINFLP